MSGVSAYGNAVVGLGYAVGLQLYDRYNQEQIPMPANPTVKTHYTTNPKLWRALAMNPFWYVVADADAEMLMGDEAKRQLYVDLVEYTLMPPLLELANIVATKMHLASLFNITKLDKMFPGLGQSWACKGTLHTIFVDQAIYARQFEAATARMKAGDWSMLCPTVPDNNALLVVTTVQMKEAAGKKELALLGASAGTGAVASTAFMAKGVEEETAAVVT
jgi:hypothetical protein